MGNHPSPSLSVRTTMTAPNLRASKRPDMNRPNSLQQDIRIDPNLSFPMLTVPHVGRPRSAMDNTNPNDVMSRVYGGMHDEPWSSVRMRTSNGATARPSFSQTYGPYREQPGSDVDKSDSGYYTHPPQSVISNEPAHVDQELPSEMTFQVGNISVNSAPTEPTEVFPMHSDQASQYSSRSTTQTKATYKCPKCKEVSKCPSDYKFVFRLPWCGTSTDYQRVGSTCSSMISPIHAMSWDAAEPLPVKVSPPSMIFKDTRRVFIALEWTRILTNAHLRIAGTKARYGRV